MINKNKHLLFVMQKSYNIWLKMICLHFSTVFWEWIKSISSILILLFNILSTQNQIFWINEEINDWKQTVLSCSISLSPFEKIHSRSTVYFYLWWFGKPHCDMNRIKQIPFIFKYSSFINKQISKWVYSQYFLCHPSRIIITWTY